MLVRVVVGIVAVLAVAAAVFVGKAWYDSRLPGSYNAMDFGTVDYGGGPAEDHSAHPHTTVDKLGGPRGAPDARFTLVAKQARVTLRSGKTIDAWAFNGRVPGPERGGPSEPLSSARCWPRRS